MFVVDTDHITILQQQTRPEFNRLLQRMGQHVQADFYFTIISFHEQVMGANSYIAKAQAAQGVVSGYRKLQKILTHYGGGQVLPFDHPAAIVFDSLRRQQIRIGTMDLRIAAIALSRDMVVLTRNSNHFRKVPGLKVEDWTV